jgi:DNA-binding PadR family transcriptional regulator
VPPELTTTSYAILGLLAIKPWTTYELAQQMGRSFRNFWPRAESRIYEEPKRLVRLGLARATEGRVGQRPRTVYRITAKGRAALVRWVESPGSGPELEFENLVKVFFAEHSSKAETLARVEEIRSWSEAKMAEHIRVSRAIWDGGGPFPDRIPQLVLVGRLLTDLAETIGSWADWAASVVRAWPDEGIAREPDWEAIEQMATRPIPGASRQAAAERS